MFQLKTNQISDSTRIKKKIIPTINKLKEHNAKVVLISHFGRPKGEWLEQYSLDRVARELGLLSEKKVFSMIRILKLWIKHFFRKKI